MGSLPLHRRISLLLGEVRTPSLGSVAIQIGLPSAMISVSKDGSLLETPLRQDGLGI